MRISSFFIGIQVSCITMLLATNTPGQTVTLDVRETPVKQVFTSIEKQAGVSFAYNEAALKDLPAVSMKITNAALSTVLEALSKKLPLQFKQAGTIIGVSRVAPKPSPPPAEKIQVANPPVTIKGKVVNEKGTALQGVTVSIKGSNIGTVTDESGNFSITVPDKNAVLLFSYIGYQTQEVIAGGQREINMTLKEATSELDQVQIIGYGTTTKRLSTGNVSTVKAETIVQQPVTNPLLALSGRVPGLQVTQNNGLPGAPVTVQIRGRNSINASNNPLYIVDGVPFPSDPIEYIGLVNSEGGVFGSPLNTINPNNIQSIEILKDADATAIYGSRAANGVILITTKTPGAGKLKTTVDFSSGVGKATSVPQLLNTEQYLQLRADAFTNSGILPTAANAPDVLLWDKNKSFDYFDWYIGNSTHQSDAAVTLTGGKGGLSFLLSGNYRYETSILPSETKFERGNGHVRINYLSDNRKAEIQMNGYYSKSYNRQGEAGATLLLLSFVPPNYPIYNDNGQYNWTAGVTNYLAKNNAYSKSNTDNLNASLTLLYRFLPQLVFRTSLGLSKLENDIFLGNPSITRNHATHPKGISNFSNQSNNTVLVEPQITYSLLNNHSKVNFLLGGTLQYNKVKGDNVAVLNYPSDLLLESRNYGIVGNISSNTAEYKYLSAFTRVTYAYKDKYLLNGNLRRDGSSRFGAGKKFGDFYSMGAAWIFSNEKFVQSLMSFLSFGKLRGSYGTTGNDGIGDYTYLSLYASTNNYGEQNAVIPKQIANNNYNWEVNKKLEFAFDMGLAKDRVLLSLAWYRNRSGNQLVSYALPSTTGFTGYTANLPAIVQNKGWEVELSTTNLNKPKFRWTTGLNISLPENKLVRFPELISSSYANSLIIGYPLNVVQQLKFLGVDAETGLTQIEDINNDGVYTRRSSYNDQGGDYVVSGTTDPKFYGGISNTISFHNFKIDIFIQFVKQEGYNFRRAISAFGRANNTYVDNLNYWRQPGDQVSVPKPFVSSNASLTNYSASSATFGDASFVRVKTLSLSYSFAETLLSRLKIKAARLYINGQNLWTITNYLGVDPENASGSVNLSIPPIRTLIAGIQISI